MNNTYLIAGDSHTFAFTPFTLKDGQQAKSSTHNLNLAIRGINAIDIQGISSNEGWVCNLSVLESLKLEPSNYTCAVVITWNNGNNRETVEQFILIVKPNLSNLQTFDSRSEAEKALAECQKALAKFNNEGILVKKLQIASRVIEFQTLNELIELANYWEKQVAIHKQNTSRKYNNKMLQIGFTNG
jgi:hypothetical protein